jgi:hypothetical protein
VLVPFRLRRCVWCNRVWTKDGWQQLVDEPQPDQETATGTMCPKCAEPSEQSSGAAPS